MLAKCVLTILELNWNKRIRDKQRKIEHLSSYAHVVHTDAKQVISRRRENVFKMSKNEKCTCKACKPTGFFCCFFVLFLLLFFFLLLSNMQICDVFVPVVVVVA